MRRRYPFYKQLDLMDCGPSCLKMICKYHGKEISRTTLSENAHTTRDGTSLGGIVEAAESVGLQCLALNCNFQTLSEDIPLPCIIYWRQKHYVVVYEIVKKRKKTKIVFADPSHGIIEYSEHEFLQAWYNKREYSAIDDNGVVLVLEPTTDFYEKNEFSGGGGSKKGVKFLYKYFTPYGRLTIQLFVGLLVGSILQLIFPFLTQAVVDVGINYKNLDFIYLVLVAQLVLFLSQSSVQIIRSWILLHITSRVNIRLLSSFLLKLMKLRLGFFESKNVGDILQRIQDHNKIQSFISSTTLNFIFSSFNILIFSAVLFYYNSYILLIFLLGTIAYTAWTLLFMRKRAELDYKRFDQAASNQSRTIQLINGIREIKLNGSGNKRRWEWESIQVRLFKLSVKGLSITQAQTIGATFINEVKNIIIIFFSANMVINGQITLGMMLSIQYIIGQLNTPLSNLISFIQLGQDARLSIERISEIHNLENEEQEHYIHELPSNKSIQIQNLSFKYGGVNAAYVLKNINCYIPQGSITAIVGASGSGKTTLMKLLLRFFEPTSGSIKVGSGELSSLSPKYWRQNCAVVMQDGYIFSDSIANNIAESETHAILNKDKVAHAAEVANISDFINELPSGYNTNIGESGMNLSGGQKQRILIARAIYKDPEYIFFDEATSALDAGNERIIVNNLNNFFKEKTVITIAHRLSTVVNADNIIVLDKGEIVEQGCHNDLVRKKGFYYSLVKNQLELGK